jgi:hypothetical protein
MWDCHELGECRLSQESVVGHLEIGNLEQFEIGSGISSFDAPESLMG